MKEIVNTLKNSNKETTEFPYWLILDPKQNMTCDVFTLADQITGPFFCREDAESLLKERDFDFSKRAKVFCNSGKWSAKYKRLCKKLKV